MENAAVFLISRKKFLILRKRDGSRKGQWSGPGGHIEWGETPKQGAIRELKEETGIVYDKLKGEEIMILQQGKTRIYVLKINNFPAIKLSQEHDSYAIVNYKDSKHYYLADYFQDTLNYIRNKKLI